MVFDEICCDLGGMGQGGGGGYGTSPVGGGMGGDRPRENTAILQQFLMAAAAGGMPQDQIAQAAATLGLIRDGGPLVPPPPFSGGASGGMMNSPDRYGALLSWSTLITYITRAVYIVFDLLCSVVTGDRGDRRQDFDSRPRYRDNSDGRGNYRQMSSDNRVGRGSFGGGRNDDRMFMRRVSWTTTHLFPTPSCPTHVLTDFSFFSF